MVKSIRFSIGILVQVLALICLSACQSPRVDVLPSSEKEIDIVKDGPETLNLFEQGKLDGLVEQEPEKMVNEDDSENLLDLLRALKSEGITSIMISHKLKEVIAIADSVTVLRDGETICTLDPENEAINEQAGPPRNWLSFLTL